MLCIQRGLFSILYICLVYYIYYILSVQDYSVTLVMTIVLYRVSL